MTDGSMAFPTEGHPVAERVRYLQSVYAEELTSDDLDEPRRRAIEQVAKERGCTVKTVRNILSGWEKKRAQQAKRAAEYAANRQTSLETYDRPITDEWLSAFFALQRDMHQALYHLGLMKRLVANLEDSQWYPKGGLRHALGAIKVLKQALEDAQPLGLCPYCKQVPVVMEECAACVGKGILLDSQMKDVPPQYLSRVLMTVLYRGQDRPLCEFQPEAKQEEMWTGGGDTTSSAG